MNVFVANNSCHQQFGIDGKMVNLYYMEKYLNEHGPV